ncbi:MAG: hypothetical protein AAGA44_06965 [Pseudomonadota bacterium]
MVKDGKADVGGFFVTLYDAFSAPGRLVVFLLLDYFPDNADWLGLRYGEEPVTMVFLISLAAWFLALVLLSAIGRFARNLARDIEGHLFGLEHRASQGVAGMRTSVTLWLRRWLPKRGGKSLETGSVEFNRVELSVLTSAYALGEDAKLTPKSLADVHNLKPDRIQRALENLREHRLLDVSATARGTPVEYRMTPSGMTYASMLDRGIV